MKSLAPLSLILLAGFGPPQTTPAPTPSPDPEAAAAGRAFLSGGVWRGAGGRGDACAQDGNFQAFSFLRPASVEVGQGRPGAGTSERL